MDKTPIIEWLLEKDNPSVRYFALTRLLDAPEEDRDVQAARRAIMRSDPVRSILAAQDPEGYWIKPGHGYSPKYRSTDWSILFLAEFGADPRNRRVGRGCEYLLGHAHSPSGGFSFSSNLSPSGAVHCLNGNLIWALVALGWADDPRVQKALDWLAASITGEEFDRYYAWGVSGPMFACGINLKQPCAWGAVKALRALANLPPALRTPRVDRAQAAAVEFLLSRDPAKADYPYTGRVSQEWFRFGFPLSYTSDVLEVLLALSEAGAARDTRLGSALDLLESKRGADGRWVLRHSLNGRTIADVEKRGEPSKWITLRGLRVLRAAGRL